MESCDLQLKLQFSLKSLAAISVAASLWEIPAVQQQIQNYFTDDYEWDGLKSLQGWRKVKLVVYDIMKSLELDPLNKIKNELQCLVQMMGEKICSWYHYVIVDLGLKAKFARRIYWNSLGGIDVGKIFQNYWQYEADFYSYNLNANDLGPSIFTFACLFVQEDFINKNSGKMINSLNVHLKSVKEVYSVSEIMMIYLRYYFLGKVECSFNELEHLNCLVMFNGLSHAYKFLNINCRPDSNALCSVLEYAQRNGSGYIKDKFMDIFLFCFKQMSGEEKANFFIKHKIVILEAFLQVWPYQTFFLQLLAAVTEMIDTNVVYPMLLNYIVKMKMERDHDVPEIYKNADDAVFMKIFKMMSNDQKRDTLLRKNYLLCNSLFYSFSYKVLCFILSDPDVEDMRDEIINEGDKHFFMLVNGYLFDEMNGYMDNLKLMDDEKKRLKMKCSTLLNFDLIPQCIEFGFYRKLDQLLVWLSDSEIDRINYKKGINAEEIIFKILENTINEVLNRDCDWDIFVLKLQKINKFLIWLFDNNEEIVDFKLKFDAIEIYRRLIKEECISGTFKPVLVNDFLKWQCGSDEGEKVKEIKLRLGSDDEFIFGQIGVLWLSNLKSGGMTAKSESLKFLSWFYDSNEMVLNKLENILESKRFVKMFVKIENQENEELKF